MDSFANSKFDNNSILDYNLLREDMFGLMEVLLIKSIKTYPVHSSNLKTHEVLNFKREK